MIWGRRAKQSQYGAQSACTTPEGGVLARLWRPLVARIICEVPPPLSCSSESLRAPLGFYYRVCTMHLFVPSQKVASHNGKATERPSRAAYIWGHPYPGGPLAFSRARMVLLPRRICAYVCRIYRAILAGRRRQCLGEQLMGNRKCVICRVTQALLLKLWNSLPNICNGPLRLQRVSIAQRPLLRPGIVLSGLSTDVPSKHGCRRQCQVGNILLVRLLESQPFFFFFSYFFPTPVACLGVTNYCIEGSFPSREP